MIGLPGFTALPKAVSVPPPDTLPTIRHQFIPVGIENNTDRNFKNLEEMLGRAKAWKRNNRECKGMLIGRVMVPRFSRPPRFRHSVFHALSKSRGRLRAEISRRGWQADLTSRILQTRTRDPARASFVWDFLDFVETSQDPDVHGTTSTVSVWRTHYLVCSPSVIRSVTLMRWWASSIVISGSSFASP